MFNKVQETFDLFTEPVAQLNMRGRTQKTSVVGSVTGFALAGLILWFMYLRSVIMVNRLKPFRFEISEDIDLMADETPIVNLKDYQFSVGIGMYGLNYEEYCEYDDDGFAILCESQEFETSIELSRVESVFDILGETYSMKNKKELYDVKIESQCDNWDNTTFFFIENAICFSDVEIYGDFTLGKG